MAANGKTGNYIDALLSGDWMLPYGHARTDRHPGRRQRRRHGGHGRQIVANADRLIADLKTRYPGARMCLIGTLATRRGNYGGGRRTQVDALLGTVAARHGMPFVGVGDWLTKYGLTKDLADAVHMNAAGRKTLGRSSTAGCGSWAWNGQPLATPDRLMAQGSLAPVASNQDLKTGAGRPAGSPAPSELRTCFADCAARPPRAEASASLRGWR